MEWISVNNALPDKNSDVIIYDEIARVQIACLDKFDDWDAGDYCFEKVTHWMPLPEPPTN